MDSLRAWEPEQDFTHLKYGSKLHPRHLQPDQSREEL